MDLLQRLQDALDSRYVLERELGQGGMATVFLAEDPRHARKVALKVLRPELAAALGAERFTREIRIAARLQHPHILPLLDSGEAGGFLYYVMPYVEGQSLRERLARQGELPVHDAVRILIEMVDALAHAHGLGVVHRDIKPDNVMLSGRHALVMDFGVAKAVSEATGRQSLTTAGVALGTPAYMAPEQATADPSLDHRVDIYAVGIVAYELLTGRTPFAGLTPQQTLAAHLTEEPAPMTRYRPALPPALVAVVMRCLAKHPADRWQSAGDLLAALEPLATPSGGLTPAGTQPIAALTRGHIRWVPVAVAGGLLAVIAGGAVVFAGRSRADAGPVLGRRTQVTLEAGLELDPALSPDGRFIAYAAGPVGGMKLMVRQLEGGNTIPVTAGLTGNLRRPQWSPDGTRIAFTSPRGIEVIPALGGRPRLVAETATPDTASDAGWSPDGTRIAYRLGDTLYTRAADGTGAPTKVGVAHELHSPAWSPDGRWIAFVSGNRNFSSGDRANIGNIAPSSVALIPAKGGGSIEIAGGGSFNTSPVWLPNGRSILFISDREGGRDVYRLALDGRGRPTGEPERLTTGLNAGSVSLSGDGRRLAYAAFVQTANVYALPSSDRGVMTEDQARAVTSGNQLMERVLVSPDGRWLAFDTNRNGNQDIYRVPVEGGEPEQVTGDRADEFINAWSPDGSEIIYHTFRSGNRDIYVIPATGGEPRPLVVSPAQDRDGSLTPDGRRLGFASDRTGRFEVYLQTREGDGWGKPIRLTDDGGIFPTVSRDGRSIVFAHGKRVALIPTEGGKTEDLVFSGPLAGREEEVLVFDLGQDGRSGLAAFPADSTGVNEVWSVPFDGGTPRRVARFAGRGLGFGRGGLSESGGTLYLLLARSESDLWTVELGGR